MKKLHTIKLIYENEEIETLKRVMSFAHGYSQDIMEVEFSDGYVTRYDMKNVTKIEIE